MKKSLFLVASLFLSVTAFSQSNTNVRYQQSYYKPSTGTYVEGHYKTQNNNTNTDNYSTKGNTNTYSQETGSKAKEYSTEASNYGNGKTIYTGSRGGQYYINGNGNKTYVPKN